MNRWTSANICWSLAYVGMVVAIVVGLRSYRVMALANYGSAQADDHWQDWREAAEELGRSGPVQRNKPQSAEPPPLVLMRDHFPACLGISLLLSSCLFVCLMFTVRGALRPTRLLGEDES